MKLTAKLEHHSEICWLQMAHSVGTGQMQSSLQKKKKKSVWHSAGFTGGSG